MKYMHTFATSGYRLLNRKELDLIHNSICGFPIIGAKRDVAKNLIRVGLRKVEVDKTDPKMTIIIAYDEAMNILTTINQKYDN